MQVMGIEPTISWVKSSTLPTELHQHIPKCVLTSGHWRGDKGVVAFATGTDGGTWTHKVFLPTRFERVASANFTTSAYYILCSLSHPIIKSTKIKLNCSHLYILRILMVQVMGVEPTRLSTQEPKSCTSANSATPACK